MTQRELVIRALEHEETQLVPYQMGFTEEALARLISHTGDEEIGEKLSGCMNSIEYWGWPTELEKRPGFFRDDFGVIWNRSGPDKDVGVIEGLTIGDLETTSYKLPTCDTQRLRLEYEDLIKNKKKNGMEFFTTAGFSFSMFERSWALMGMENVLVNMISCPEKLEAFYDKLCENLLELVDIALEYDIDGVYFGDDWGQQFGLIMGPHHWRRFIKPKMAQLFAKVKGAGKYTFLHSCGDCGEIFPDLIEIGLDCYQTFQPEIYDIKKVKELYGRHLSFWGGISTQQCLPRTDAEGVKKETIRVMQILRRGGGFIAAPTHSLPKDIPPENILAMADVFMNQGKYLCS